MNRLATIAIPVALATAAVLGFNSADAVPSEAQGKTIVDVAVGTGAHNTLVAAVKAAGYVELLSGSDELTVFAPTDRAFSALESGLVESLLEKRNLATLQEVLGYHVVAGRMTAADIIRETELRTLSGQRVTVDVRADGVFIGGAKVVTADVAADNGIVHVLGGVMLPATDDVVTVASNAGAFGTLLTAVRAAGLVEAINGDTPLTILAPTDSAFAALDQKLLGSLLEPDNKTRLQDVLKLHVIPGRLSALDLATYGTVETLGGQRLPVRVIDGRITVGGAALTGNDVESTNATVHVLESVILPR